MTDLKAETKENTTNKWSNFGITPFILTQFSANDIQIDKLVP